MDSKRQFSLAFVFLQIACIAIAIGAGRALTLKIMWVSSFEPSIGLYGLFLIFVCAAAIGAFVGGFFRKTVLGGILGLVSVPVLFAVFALAIFALAAIGVRGPWNL